MKSASSAFKARPSVPAARPLLGRQHGLTLIELMFAIAITAILSGFAIALYDGYTDEADMYQVLGKMRSIAFILDDMVSEDALPDSLDDIAGDYTDPWGNPLQYLRIQGGDVNGLGKVRKDRSLVPLNTDYDLYSMGPDGDSKAPLTAQASHDDLIRANNGGFFGVGEDY